MANSKVNGFWRGVPGHPPEIETCSIRADTLDDAVRAAFAMTDIMAAFRRNREVIDLGGRFRQFLYDGLPYIAKIARLKEGQSEQDNSREASRRLSGVALEPHGEIEVVVPFLVSLSADWCALVAPDYGYTLHEKLDTAEATFSEEDVLRLLRILLDRGVEWRGCVPRNIICDRDIERKKVILIDWENASFFEARSPSGGDSLALFIWTLNWSQVYGGPGNLRAKLISALSMSSVTATTLDGFERTYRDIVDDNAMPDEVRERCSEITFASEGLLQPRLANVMTPMEIGHLIDDLLPPHLSVFYSVATAKMRQTFGDADYAAFIMAMMNMLRLSMAQAGAAHSITFELGIVRQSVLLIFLAGFNPARRFIFDRLDRMTALDNANRMLNEQDAICAAFLEHQRLRESVGWEVAVRRSDVLDEILGGLFSRMLSSFGMKKTPDLLVRGSLGQGVVSKKSDADFEVSSPQRPFGHTDFENSIGAVLSTFQIGWEGSSARPTEADLIAPSGLTRDWHEWTELRRPCSERHNPGWLSTEFESVAEGWWMRQSAYERSGRPLTGKYLFFEARSLIARLAFKNDLKQARTNRQLSHLADFLPKEQLRRLSSVANDALAMYEEEAPATELIRLRAEIDRLRGLFNLTGPISL